MIEWKDNSKLKEWVKEQDEGVKEVQKVTENMVKRGLLTRKWSKKKKMYEYNLPEDPEKREKAIEWYYKQKGINDG